ncbi:hypothetical protein NQ317_013083, partial [Molorchus minor]
VIAIFYAYLKWSYQYWKRRDVPYLERSIPFGNFENPINKWLSLGTRRQKCTEKHKLGNVVLLGLKYCGIYIFALPRILVLDLDFLKHVLTKDFSHFVDRGTYTNWKDDPLKDFHILA